ncbi:MAG: cupin domain-containing protein, partial [Myxococcales bacterium]|nr:cupin domain-containing protein [Myxococcales bacterium]
MRRGVHHRPRGPGRREHVPLSGLDRDGAQAIIHRLGLQPHPEGGWYRETWRA